MGDQIIEVLNQDEKSRKMLKRFEELAEQENLTGEKYNEARKTILMVIIASNKKAMSLMAEETYNALRA